MMRWLRRLFWLGVLTGAGLGAYRFVASTPATPSGVDRNGRHLAEPESPVTPRPQRAPPPLRGLHPSTASAPDGYPVKANDNSGIFHTPGGRFYDRTVAERCYADAEDAIADGYRPAKA